MTGKVSLRQGHEGAGTRDSRTVPLAPWTPGVPVAVWSTERGQELPLRVSPGDTSNPSATMS